MTAPSKAEIRGELETAQVALASAELNLQHDLATAVNRAYYACFHAARAILWSHGLAPRTHKGVRKLFHEYLIAPQVVERDFGDILRNTADERETADYHATTGSFRQEEVAVLVGDARRFVEHIQSLLAINR